MRCRLLNEGRRSELLDLPPQFDADLAAWLADEAVPDAARRLQIRCKSDCFVFTLWCGQALAHGMSCWFGLFNISFEFVSDLVATATWSCCPY